MLQKSMQTAGMRKKEKPLLLPFDANLLEGGIEVGRIEDDGVTIACGIRGADNAILLQLREDLSGAVGGQIIIGSDGSDICALRIHHIESHVSKQRINALLLPFFGNKRTLGIVHAAVDLAELLVGQPGLPTLLPADEKEQDAHSKSKKDNLGNPLTDRLFACTVRMAAVDEFLGSLRFGKPLSHPERLAMRPRIVDVADVVMGIDDEHPIGSTLAIVIHCLVGSEGAGAVDGIGGRELVGWNTNLAIDDVQWSFRLG